MPDANAPENPSLFAVFLATSENLGLSTTLRNTADVLAEAGRSVLLVDGRGRAPATALPPPVRGEVRAVVVEGGDRLTALGDDPVALSYDHVLIEVPVPDTPEAAASAGVSAFADALVFCFAMTAWSIDGAAALAEDLASRRTRQPPRLLTLGLKSDVGVHDRLREARERARRRFAPLAPAGGPRDVPLLEIPYNPLYQDSRSLAVEAEEAGTVAGLRPYYERLADWLRARRLTRLTHATVVHSARHAGWAAWLCDRLAAKGVRAELRRSDTYTGERPDHGSALLLLAPDDTDDPLLAQIGALSHTDVRVVLVDESFPHPEAAHHERVDLRRADEGEALALLYASLGLGAPEQGPRPATDVLFPRLPETADLAPRNRAFTGRDGLLTTLDEQLRAAGAAGSCLVLHAPTGFGKSEAALEHCHRQGPGYDIVWWLRSWDRPTAERALVRLAGRLRTPEDHPGAPAEETVSRLLARLSRPDSDIGTWLLVYDGAARPDDLNGLLPVPHADGHVLITSRERPRTPPGDDSDRPPYLAALAMPTLTRDESRVLLTDLVPQLTAGQADQVAGVLDRLPHALTVAGHCLAERTALHHRDDHLAPDAAARAAVTDLLDAFRTHKTALLRTADSAPSLDVMVRVARDFAHSTVGAAAWQAESPDRDALDWLLNAASLLTGRGMGLELLRSRRILSELGRDDDADQPAVTRHPDDVQLPDEHMVGVALWSLSRVGLLDIDFDRDRPLAQHHALRDLIRARMDPDERRHIEGVLRGALAEHTPSAHQSLPAGWAREIHALRLWEDPRPRVRRALLRHLGALGQRAESADLDRLLDIAGRARTHWHSAGDEQSPEYLRLLNFVARAHRLRGDYDTSRRLAQDALRGHRRLLGLIHPRTLLSADSYAATLRALGRFEDALLEVRPALEGLTLLLGPQHPATLQVEHNLALTETLTGRVPAALSRVQNRFRHGLAVDDPAVWDEADLLAYLYRWVGRDSESRDLLRLRLHRLGTSPSSSAVRLRTQIGLAISERRIAGGFPAVKDPRYGYELALQRDRQALDTYLRRFGADRYDTLRCRFSYAADLHALGKTEEAEQHARQSADAVAQLFGVAHPYTALCQVRLGVYLRDSAPGRLTEAEAAQRGAVGLLGHRLGRAHPWVAAAENSLAVTLAEAGRTDEAVALSHTVLGRLRDLGLADRPDGRRVRAHHEHLTDPATSRPRPASGYDIDLELPGL